jgi:hypothetical protein
MRLGDYTKQIINTLYGNPFRRAWIELNYIYYYIIEKIEKISFKLFQTEATWFLSKDEDILQQTRNVNLCNLRLSDMGDTTLSITPTPYGEIAQEAFAVWELFEKYTAFAILLSCCASMFNSQVVALKKEAHRSR